MSGEREREREREREIVETRHKGRRMASSAQCARAPLKRFAAIKSPPERSGNGNDCSAVSFAAR